MNLRYLYRLALGLFALLVVGLQSGAMAHATQFGDDDHEHDSMVCMMDAVSVETKAVLPTLIYVPRSAQTPPVIYTAVSDSKAYLTPPGRAPPPRSPPLVLF